MCFVPRRLVRATVLVLVVLLSVSGMARAAEAGRKILHISDLDLTVRFLDPTGAVDGAQSAAAAPDVVPYPATRDWRGIKRDTGYFLAYQFVIIGLLYVMPESISSWSDEDKEKYSFEKWKNNVSEPVKDEDDHFINYVLHPYWGATYYIRARERGYPSWNAFGYSVLLSTLYEYGAEALFEPVSIQDLVVTPVVGSLVGRYLFEMPRARIKAKPGPRSFGDKLILVGTDPLGAANNVVDDLFGPDAGAQLGVDLSPPRGQRPGDYVGLRLSFKW